MQLDYDFTLLFMIFLRMTGCIVFNPIFGRKNVPVMLQVGITLMLTLFTYGLLPNTGELAISSIVVFFIVMIKELAIGFIIGFIVNIFFSVLILAGEMMDMQIGISMSKVYDPGSNVSMAISASMVNAMMLIIFFLSNSHLTMIEVFNHAARAIPYGELSFAPELFLELAMMFSQALVLALKMAMPVLAAQMITEVSVGIIMKAVPQINVFIVNLQLKIIIGFIMLALLVPSFSAFIEKLTTLMFDKINLVLTTLG